MRMLYPLRVCSVTAAATFESADAGPYSAS